MGAAKCRSECQHARPGLGRDASPRRTMLLQCCCALQHERDHYIRAYVLVSVCPLGSAMANVLTGNRPDISLFLSRKRPKGFTNGNKTERCACWARSRGGLIVWGGIPARPRSRRRRSRGARSRCGARLRDWSRDRRVTDSFLLDTHIVLQLDSGDDHLRPSTGALLDRCWQNGGTLLLSAVTAWEVALLVDTGRIELDVPIEAWIKRFLDRPGVEPLPLSHRAGSRTYQLYHLGHRDPADRLLVATALELACPLVTYDERIARFARKHGTQ